MVVSHSDFVPILIEVRLDRGILLNVDARKFSPNAVVRADNPQLRPLVAVAFNISAAENGSFTHRTRPKPSSTTDHHSPTAPTPPRAADPSEGLPLVHQDRDVALE